METVQAGTLSLDRGFLRQVACPRCKVTALYHPRHQSDSILCIGCGFTDTTKQGRKDNGNRRSETN